VKVTSDPANLAEAPKLILCWQHAPRDQIRNTKKHTAVKHQFNKSNI